MTGAAHLLAVGATFHGRYRVVRCIAAGGMGAVYEAVHEHTLGRCALKVMLPRLVHDPDMRARFLQEARIAAQIPSDHIVRVFDAGIDEATAMPFLVMELLEGEDLAGRLARETRLDPTTVVALLGQVAIALDRTHAAGVVHRDLKPHNLFLTQRDDGTTLAKILDFGIAKLVDSEGVSGKTRNAGTPLYMPPEQMRGDPTIGPPADVYALAHIAFTMLAGISYWRTELQDLGLHPALGRIIAGPSEPATVRARRHGVELPSAVDAWFVRASNPDPHKRPQRASEAIAELAAALGLPADAVRVSAREGSPITPGRPLQLAPPPAATAGRWPPAQATAATAPELAQPAVAAWPFAGQAPPPVAAPEPTAAPVSATAPNAPAPATRRTPVVLALAAVALALMLGAAGFGLGRLREPAAAERDRSDEDDDEPRATSTTSAATSAVTTPACYADKCVPIEPNLDAPLEALDWLERATRLAREVEPSAQLLLINVQGAHRGRLAPSAATIVSFMFGYDRRDAPGTRSALSIVVHRKQMTLHRSVDVNLSVVPVPRCSLQAALRAAAARGLSDDKAEVSALYTGNGVLGPSWILSSNRAAVTLDGMTCAVRF